MQARFFPLFVLLVGTVIALPIHSRSSSKASQLERTLGSPRISCTESYKHIICQKFEAAILHQGQDASPLGDRFSTSITDLDRQAAEENHQVQKIMDVKVKEQVGVLGMDWAISDVQVVLWIILLCCLTEGIVSGFRW